MAAATTTSAFNSTSASLASAASAGTKAGLKRQVEALEAVRGLSSGNRRSGGRFCLAHAILLAGQELRLQGSRLGELSKRVGSDDDNSSDILETLRLELQYVSCRRMMGWIAARDAKLGVSGAWWQGIDEGASRRDDGANRWDQGPAHTVAATNQCQSRGGQYPGSAEQGRDEVRCAANCPHWSQRRLITNADVDRRIGEVADQVQRLAVEIVGEDDVAEAEAATA